MKPYTNPYIKGALIILLIISSFEMSYEFYEIVRFIFTSAFVWLSVNEKRNSKFGWSFLFGTLAVLFNPFFTIKVGAEIWRVVDLSVAFILFINLIESFIGFRQIMLTLYAFNYKKLFNTLSTKKNIRFYKSLILIAITFLTIFSAYKRYQQVQEKNRIRTESILKKHYADSVYRVQLLKRRERDSVIRIQRNKDITRRSFNQVIFCTEKKALESFKDYMQFNHPTWEFVTKPRIKKTSECTFRISVVLRNSDFDLLLQKETLIVDIEFVKEEFYEKYNFNLIQEPNLFK